MEWYLEAMRKYAQFSGRSRRKEYWIFTLINVVIGVVGGIAAGATGVFASRNGTPAFAFLVIGLLGLYSLAIFIPGLAVSVRRLHDTGKSGLFLLICLVPFIGSIIILVFMIQDSQPGPNQYGPNPKELPGNAQYAAAYPRY